LHEINHCFFKVDTLAEYPVYHYYTGIILFCHLQAALYQNEDNLYQFSWLLIASVCIAAAGYIINDYFDLNIDRINKPDKNVIGKIISRRWAILWHMMLSILGLLATAVAVSFQKWYLILANLICVILLWLYSTSFKKQLLVGNIVISILTAWTILILFFAHIPFMLLLELQKK
jgi:4-hydroxybenzoate polyprenyltransferase